MTKQDFCKYLDELTSETGFELTKEQKAFAYQAAKEYHNQALRIHDVVARSEQLESGLTCMMCRKPKQNDGHTCCEECAGLAF